jgi:hypothetical protein
MWCEGVRKHSPESIRLPATEPSTPPPVCNSFFYSALILISLAWKALEYGPDASSDEDDAGGEKKRASFDQALQQEQRAPKAYDEDQEKLRREFLTAAADKVKIIDVRFRMPASPPSHLLSLSCL